MDGSLGMISGWGTTSSGASAVSPETLRAAFVNIVSQARCNSSYSGLITSRMICAAARGKDACQG